VERTWLAPALFIVVALVSACGTDDEPSERSPELIHVPAQWTPVIQEADAAWSKKEGALLNAALYLLEQSMVKEDPRRALLRSAHLVASDQVPAVEGPLPERSEAMYSVRTGNIYVKRPTRSDWPALASTLAHELHHMECDRTNSVNRMQECDRERIAHAREARDVERMMDLIHARSANPKTWLPAFEIAHAKARSLAAMYTAKYELFHLVQALDQVNGLRDIKELYKGYERCIEVAEGALSTDHSDELQLFDQLFAASKDTPAETVIAAPLRRARDAVLACGPLDAVVGRLRAREGSGAR
jgi:hypothetical protein